MSSPVFLHMEGKKGSWERLVKQITRPQILYAITKNLYSHFYTSKYGYVHYSKACSWVMKAKKITRQRWYTFIAWMLY